MFSSIMALGALLLTLSMTVVASPVQLSRRVKFNLDSAPPNDKAKSRSEISSELLSNFTLFAQFAALSACDQNINATGNKLTCDYDGCGLVEDDDTETIFTFHNATGPTGYIALDHTRKLTVLTFRGTVSKYDGETDFKYQFTAIEDVCPGCNAHEGFWGYWSSAADVIISELRSATTSHPDYSLTVVGHSLGGAVATLAGTILRTKGFSLDIWTFGSPKVGNYKLAEFITNQRAPVSVYRATHYTDVVPKLPLTLTLLGFDYSHPSPEYWIDQPTGEKVTTDVVKFIEGINSLAGNAGQHVWIQWPDPNHGWYFGNMSVCPTPADSPPPEDS